jgi:hypothetical protein
MNMRLLVLALVGWLTLTSAATTEVQSRFENSLRAASSTSRVEVEWLDTLWIRDPQALKAMRVNEGAFTRVFHYSYLASGAKYRVSCQLVSGTGTNLVRHTEAAFDGSIFYHYTADFRYLTKTREATLAGAAESQGNPLVAPFMFLTRQSDDCINCDLRFTELATLKAPQELALLTEQELAADVEISVLGLPVGGQPTTWKLELEGAGEAFVPKTITRITSGWRLQTVNKLLNYTNLGGYLFPTRIEWTGTSYPATSPPTLSATGTVRVVSARIPREAPAQALFTLEEEAKVAETVWNADEHKFNRVAPEVAKAKAELASKPRIYDESADGASQLAEALVLAKTQHKRVLLQFGANWCAACHDLHEFFESEQSVAEVLKQDYVVVRIDVNKGHNHGICLKYGQPYFLPTIVVVEDDGKMLTAGNPENWIEGHRYGHEKVLAFLNEWAPKK